MARRQKDNAKGSWGELILFLMVVMCIYLTLALFDSSLTGENGRRWGDYLRNVWGGSVIVLLLFWMYFCIARLMKLRIPRLPRQILGTIQLYISFAFMLGFLKETGWESRMTLFRPGSLGSGLAHFFVLNIGTFITLLLVAGSFLLSAVFYGSKILSLPMPSFSFKRRKHKSRRREDYEDSTQETPESILFGQNIPSPKLKSPSYDYDDAEDSAQIQPPEIEMPRLKKPEQDFTVPIVKPTPKLKTGQKAIDMIDDALALLNSGVPETPAKKPSALSQRTRKIRRPLPDLTFSGNPASTDDEEEKPAKRTRRDDAVFPPPPEIFGERSRFDASRASQREIDRQGRAIVASLQNFNITAEVAQASSGPSITQYKLELSPGTKVSKVSGLDEEIAMDLAVKSVRIEAPILGTHYVGVEVPNAERKTVTLRSVIESGDFINTSARLPLPMGVKAGGKVIVRGLEELPNLLVAGAEGSGRKTFLNTCIVSLCSTKTPEELKLILVDTKHVIAPLYEGLPHLLAEPAGDIAAAQKALEWACGEAERRMEEFSKEKARNVEAYNRKVPKSKRIPEIVVVINELADLVYSTENDFSGLILKLARKAGSAGIYVIVSMQKPSVDVMPSLMKSVITARAAFALTSAADSRNIMDTADAARLTGKGDMLFISTASPVPVRLQAAFIDEERIADFVEYMSSSLEPPELVTF